jgi:protein TonB
MDLISMARRYKRYPRVALDNNWEGRVVVRMLIGANGMIASLQVTASSGHDVLDEQALDMIRKAKPLVPIPPAMRGREFPVEIPVHYNLKDQDSG